jgi:L-rhamnose mutarotase
VKRYGQVIRVKLEKLEAYKELHASVWPEVLKTIKACHIDNYSIFYLDGLLFAYFEYTGHNYEADMANMAADPITQRWWEVCKPCQEPLESCSDGGWWADMAEVFHID